MPTPCDFKVVFMSMSGLTLRIRRESTPLNPVIPRSLPKIDWNSAGLGSPSTANYRTTLSTSSTLSSRKPHSLSSVIYMLADVTCPCSRSWCSATRSAPYGLDHLNSSNFNVFLERPFIVQAFNRNNRRFGLMSYGYTDDGAWNWRYGAMNQRVIQSDGIYTSDHWQLQMVGRIARTLEDVCDASRYVHLGLASTYAVPDGTPTAGRARNEARFRTEAETRSRTQWLDTMIIDGADDYSLLATEMVVNLGSLQVTAEYMNMWLNREAGFGEAIYLHGGYVYVSYFITGHYQPWNKQRGIIGRIKPLDDRNNRAWGYCNAWQLAVRWSYADLTDSDIQGGVGESITAGFNWYWTPHAKLQFNCSYIDISQHREIDGQTFGHNVILGTRVAVDF